MIKKYYSEKLPEFLYCYDTNEPFSNCLVCDRKLDENVDYAIEKVFKQNRNMANSEIIYEYAICMECAASMQNELSKESIASIQALFEAHGLNAMMKLEYLHNTKKYDIQAWIERCSFTGKETRLCSEYSVSALIEKGKLVYEHAPLVISDDFMELIQESLSKSTKDYLDGFRDEYFDLPPDIKDIINSPTVGIM
ncbi:hypothetical protein GYB29_09405 [bacterium]|nr:hypothetical protein [bacterium]